MTPTAFNPGAGELPPFLADDRSYQSGKNDSMTTSQQAPGVLYVIACGGRPAADLPQFVRHAQDWIPMPWPP